MKRVIYFVLLLFIGGFFNEITAQVTPGWQWAASSGGTSRDEAELPAVDPFGNVYLCGKFSDTAWFGTFPLISHGGLDMYLAKYNNSGTFLWAVSLGSASDAEGLSIAADHNGNVAVTGYFKGDLTVDSLQWTGQPGKESFFAAVFDGIGNLLWVQVAKGGNIRGKGVEFDPAGNVLVTGHYEDSLVIGTTVLHCQGLQNAFLMKFHAYGSFEWANDGGGVYNAWASSVGVDSQGNAYITGAFKDTAWFDNHQIVTYGLNDVFLAKCDPFGNWLWATHAGGTSDDYGNGIEVDAYDHIAVTGSIFLTVNFPPAPAITSYGGKDGFVAYYNPSGSCLWAHPFGGTSEDKGIGVSTDGVGNVYVTGYIYGLGNFGPIQKPSAGGNDVCIAKYTRTGQILWADVAGGTSHEYGKGIQVSQQGVAYIAGYYEGTSTFGNTTFSSKGGRESFVAKYQDGTPQIAQQPLSQNLCLGDSLILSVTVPGTSLSYAWFKDGVQLSGQVLPTYAIHCTDTLPTGKYTCLVSTLSGYVVSDTAYVNVGNYPVVDLSTFPHVTIPFFIQYTFNAGPGYSSYLWSTGDTTSSITYYGAEYSNFFQGVTGVVSVTVTNQYGCSASDSVMVDLVGSIDDGSQNGGVKAQLFPNPAKQIVQVVCSEPIERVELLTMSGQVLSATVVEKVWCDTLTISLEEIPAGVYLVRVFTPTAIRTKKLIVE